MSIQNRLGELMLEAKSKWSGEVKTKWEAPEGFFSQSAEKIAKGLKRGHKDLKGAMGSLSFYINRGGKNLSADDKARLETAKEKLRKLYNESMQTIVECKVGDEIVVIKGDNKGKKGKITRTGSKDSGIYWAKLDGDKKDTLLNYEDGNKEATNFKLLNESVELFNEDGKVNLVKLGKTVAASIDDAITETLGEEGSYGEIIIGAFYEDEKTADKLIKEVETSIKKAIIETVTNFKA